MFANRYTAFIDACSLVGALKRNLLLTLAEAEFYRVRWSPEVLDETERALAELFEKRGNNDPCGRARLQRERMEHAFEDAMVLDYAAQTVACGGIPDPGDIHVLAAALKTQAATIVTDNIKDFPADVLATLNMEVRSTDDFIADTIALDEGRAVAAIRTMRENFRNPEMTPADLLVKIEAQGLMETATVLRPYIQLL